MEEFVFELDAEGKDYYYQFGKTQLQIFDWRKYQRMLRQIKQHAIEKAQKEEHELEEKPITKEPIITYGMPEPWCVIDDFPPLLDVFDMDCYMDRVFVEKMLTVFKPR